MPNQRDPEAPGRAGRETIHDLPDGLGRLPWALPRVFLGLDGPAARHDRAQTWVLPVPYETTASWGTATRQGPQAVIDASRYVELYDQELDCVPSAEGVYTFPPLELERGNAAGAAARLEEAFGRILEAAAGRRVVMLGGEHSVSPPAILAHASRTEERLTVLQLDAHLDLHERFNGSRFSHACAMTRIAGRADLVSVGARGVSQEEWETANDRADVFVVPGEELHDGDAWMERATAALTDPVYLTLDVDFMDPSLMPSTGAPEPGGASWPQTLAFLRRVFAERRVVGVDVVEHAPIPGLAAPDFLVAKLVHKIIGYWSASGPRPLRRAGGKSSEPRTFE